MFYGIMFYAGITAVLLFVAYKVFTAEIEDMKLGKIVKIERSRRLSRLRNWED